MWLGGALKKSRNPQVKITGMFCAHKSLHYKVEQMISEGSHSIYYYSIIFWHCHVEQAVWCKLSVNLAHTLTHPFT